jgi:hypothetical protein
MNDEQWPHILCKTPGIVSARNVNIKFTNLKTQTYVDSCEKTNKGRQGKSFVQGRRGKGGGKPLHFHTREFI